MAYYTHKSQEQKAHHTTQAHVEKTLGLSGGRRKKQGKCLGQGLYWNFLGKVKVGQDKQLRRDQFEFLWAVGYKSGP